MRGQPHLHAPPADAQIGMMIHGLRLHCQPPHEVDSVQVAGKAVIFHQFGPFHGPAGQSVECHTDSGFCESFRFHGGSFGQSAGLASIAIAFHHAKR